MSVQIRFQYDDKLAQEALRVVPKQIPFAIALALTRLAKKAAAAEQREMRRVFDRPTPYTMKSLAIRPATKDRQDAEVFFKDFSAKGTPAGKYLLPNIDGGPRRVKRFERALQYAGVLPFGKMAYPGDGADLDAYGNMNRRQIVKILSYFRAFSEVGYMANRRADGKSRGARRDEQYFVGGEGGARNYNPGVYRRQNGKVTPVLIFGRQARYQPVFAFHDVARDTAARECAGEFERAAREALATARS